MKKRFFLLFSGGMLILLTCNMAMAERTSIILGTENWPPFSYEKNVNKQISGLSTEVINGTFKRMGVSITKNKVYPWIRAQSSVYLGKLDAIYTASISEERKKYCYFPSEPIITSKWVLFIKKNKKDSLNYKELSNLKKKKIGLIRGYNYPSKFVSYVKKHSIIQEVSYEKQNIAKLIGERFDYMPAVLETTLHLAKTDPILKEMDAYNKIYYFPTPLATTNFYLMFSKKTVTKEFVDRFSKALVDFKKTDDYQIIIKKYK